MVDLESALTNHTGFKIVAGGTAKHVEKFYAKKDENNNLTTIDISQVKEFLEIEMKNDEIKFGASVSLERMKKQFEQMKSKFRAT